MTHDIAVPSAATEGPPRDAGLIGAARIAGRYGLSAFGPISIAGAHFIAALIFLRLLPPAEFGLISFVFVAVPPFLSVTMSLVAASLYTTAFRQEVAQSALALHLKGSLSISLVVSVLLAGLMLGCGAGAAPAALFGLYGGLMSLRQFARCFAYVGNRQFAVAASDTTYSATLLIGLGVLFAAHAFSMVAIAGVLAGSALIALFAFGQSYLRRQLTAGVTGWLGAYATIWRDLTRWSLLGVISTEMTANAHAYLVTLIGGPGAFALLAVGALFLRPVSLFLTALPDLERASMARGIVGGDLDAAFRSVKSFRLASTIAWIGTIALTAAILVWFPGLVLKAHYAVTDVAIVVALWAAIMAVRIVRTPDGVLLQAAAEFKALALASVVSAGVSFALTLALLLTLGPVASLGGILVGDIVMTLRIRLLVRQWKARHG